MDPGCPELAKAHGDIVLPREQSALCTGDRMGNVLLAPVPSFRPRMAKIFGSFCVGVAEMVQWVEALDAKPEDVSLRPGMHGVEGEKQRGVLRPPRAHTRLHDQCSSPLGKNLCSGEVKKKSTCYLPIIKCF